MVQIRWRRKISRRNFLLEKSYLVVGAEGAAGVVFTGVVGMAGTAALFLGTIVSATELLLAEV